MLTVNDFDFHLDPEQIAQQPVDPRDASRLLVLRRTPTPTAAPAPYEHRIFRDLLAYLEPGDLLVLNRSRVIPARLFGERIPSRGKVEILLIRPLLARDNQATWNCLTHAKASLKPGDQIRLPLAEAAPAAGAAPVAPVIATLRERRGLEGDILTFDRSPEAFDAWYPAIGQMPLPPYIKRRESADPTTADRAHLAQLARLDEERYQTVYAQEKGSVAAPTAGLHFTPELLAALRQKGVAIAELILHVGPGTFRPVKAENLADHPMHEEPFDIPANCVAAIAATRAAGRRVIAVGTTAMRALESATPPDANRPTPGPNQTRLFVYPPYRFRCVDALITNFHLPKSTLLMLVSAFASPGSTAGIDQIRRAYQTAIAEGYRFFSYGDAMLIL